MVKRLTPDQLVEFKRLRSLADNAAYRLGVQRAEYLDLEKKVLEEIVRHENAQREFGEKILKDLEFDIVKDDYTCTPDGEIKRLVAGVWQDID